MHGIPAINSNFSLSPFLGIDIWNPAFDVTPNALITGGVVTELGIFQMPLDGDKILEKFNKK